MKRFLHVPMAAALVVAIAIPAALAVERPVLDEVRWGQGSSDGTESLVLTFSRSPDRWTTHVRPWGIEIHVSEVDAVAAEGEDLRVVPYGDGARIEVRRAGANLIAVEKAGATLSLRVSLPVPDALPGAAYRIGVGDVLDVAVYKNPDLSGDFTVAPDGTITMPLIGAVPAAGAGETELAATLKRILGSDYLVDPQVSVTVKTYQSQFVYVTGAVRQSRRVALRPGMTLKDVLSEAGVALVAGQEVVLSRTAGEPGEAIRLLAADVEAQSAPAPLDGDVLTVQERDYIFLQGELRRPGRYEYAEGMTLMQALSVAEGLTDWASKKDIRILRKEGDSTSEQEVDLRKIEARGRPDPVLAPGDIVIVRRRIL